MSLFWAVFRMNLSMRAKQPGRNWSLFMRAPSCDAAIDAMYRSPSEMPTRNLRACSSGRGRGGERVGRAPAGSARDLRDADDLDHDTHARRLARPRPRLAREHFLDDAVLGLRHGDAFGATPTTGAREDPR